MSHFEAAPQTAAVPIILDDDQIATVALLTGLDQRDIRIALDGVNDVLTSDPVGTIRRSPDGKVIAIRVEDMYHPYSTCVPKGSHSWRSGVEHTWPVIYRPEAQ